MSVEPGCKLSIVPGMNVIKSEPKGVWGVEITKQNLKDILELTKKFGGKNWAFLGIMTEMAPVVDPEASRIFSSFHDEFQKHNAVACAFVVGGKVALKAQTQRHHNMSTAHNLIVNHFNDEKSALEWLRTFKEIM